MGKPVIYIDPDEAQRIEKNLIMRNVYYCPSGYYSNPKSLLKALKASDAFSYEKITRPNCVHQCDILFLTHDHYRGKTYKAVLNIIDCASRYKASVPLTSKNSSEVARAFRKIYGDRNNPLTWPKLLQCDGGRKFIGKTSRLMREHNVTIRVIGSYSHRGLGMVERFNKTEADMLYKIQYAGLAPSEAILLEEVESKPSISSRRLIGKDEITLKKGDSVRYLLANAE
ncbi:15256_t:CDS:2, partial [Gigaspora rosea]